MEKHDQPSTNALLDQKIVGASSSDGAWAQEAGEQRNPCGLDVFSKVVAESCLSKVKSLQGQIDRYIKMEEELLLTKEKLNLIESKEDKMSLRMLKELEIGAAKKADEWKESILELELKLKTSEAQLNISKEHLNELQELLQSSDEEREKCRLRCAQLECELFKSNDQLEQLQLNQQIDRLQRDSEMVQLKNDLQRLSLEKEAALREISSRLDESVRKCAQHQRQLETVEQLRKGDELEYANALEVEKKRTEKERRKLEMTIDDEKSKFHDAKMQYERQINTLLLETRQLRWERDKALEEAAAKKLSACNYDISSGNALQY